MGCLNCCLLPALWLCSSSKEQPALVQVISSQLECFSMLRRPPQPASHPRLLSRTVSAPPLLQSYTCCPYRSVNLPWMHACSQNSWFQSSVLAGRLIWPSKTRAEVKATMQAFGHASCFFTHPLFQGSVKACWEGQAFPCACGVTGVGTGPHSDALSVAFVCRWESLVLVLMYAIYIVIMK